ncbi:MAG: hypothetical protein ACI4HI_00820 [Lachnospiraceae bacterium]
MREEKQTAFILPEMMQEGMCDPKELLEQNEWLEEQMHQVSVSYRASRTKMDRAVKESDTIQVKLLQEFTDIVEWMLENKTGSVKEQVLFMPDLLYQEHELRNHVLQIWYAHLEGDRKVQKAQSELQNLYRKRLANLECKDDYLQEKIEQKQRLSLEFLEKKWQEEEDEKHGYQMKKKRLEQSLEFARQHRMSTDVQMQQALDQVNELWTIIRGRVGELANDLISTTGIDGEKEAERIYELVIQEMESIKRVEEAWKKHRTMDHNVECTHSKQATVEAQDLRWMEYVYNCSQMEARKK